jgi:peptidoglycan-associated lipoprotein
MSKVFVAFCLVFLVAGCSSTEQRSASIEERSLLDETQAQEQEEFDRAQVEQAAKDAQIRREQQELNRQLEEQRQRELEEAQIEVELGADEPYISPLEDSSFDEADTRLEGDPWMQLGEPGSALAQRSIYYEYNRYDINDEYVPLIEAHANFLLLHPDLKITIQGNCDDRGSREYNLALGQRRAEGVKRALSLLGVSDEQMEAVSLGAEKPVAFGQDEDSWARNRRSDILYIGEPK